MASWQSKVWKATVFTVGGGAAWWLGGKAGDMVFGDEAKHEHFLVGRQERFTQEHPIFRFTYDKPKHEVQLSRDEWTRLPLEHKKSYGKDCVALRFQLPSAHGSAGTEAASFILLRYRGEDGKYVVRPYTPISLEWEYGYFDLLIKQYPNSKMGTHVANMNIGDRIDVKGPFQKIKVEPNKWAEVGCIAGGSGITPCWQVMLTLMKYPNNRTNVSLIYANKTPEDILLRKGLEYLELQHYRTSVYHTVSKADEEWTGGLGNVNKEMIKSKMPAPGKGKVFVCGPPGMMEAVCGKKDKMEQGPLGGMLKELGYTEDDVFKF